MSAPFSLVLTIAGIPIRIIALNKKVLSIIAKRYSNYITNKNHFANTIWLDTTRKTPSYQEGAYHLHQSLAQDNFLAFNDSFRKIFVHILSKNYGLVVHASSLIFGNRGYIFMGKEGAGKSTIRSLHKELTSLGDDTAILRFSGKKIFLYGSPFYQRTNRAYPNRKVPVQGIYALHQSTWLMISPTNFPENYELIISRCFISNLGNKKKEMALLSKTCYRLANQPLIFRLYFPKTYQFISLLKQPSQRKIDVKHHVRAINPRVSKLLPLGISWQQVAVDKNFLADCQVIKETSWQFEFGKKRQVSMIAGQVKGKHTAGPHTTLILKKTKAKAKPIFIAYQTGSKFVLLDGNHQAIAVFLRKGNQTFPLVVGQAKSPLTRKFSSIL